MRRIIFSFALFLTCHLLYAQKTVTPGELTVVFAISDDGFLNVREKPSNKGKILTTLPMCFHGLGRGILLESGERWSKVVVDNIVGWVYNKYLGYQSWYTGEGKTRLVAKKQPTPLYTDNYADDGPKYLPYGTIRKGTVLADDYELLKDGYYVLKTGHDYLFINKDDVIEEDNRRE